MAFGYKGSFLYKMQGGMGDVVFGPLYEILKRRGVKFAFFHRVAGLGVSADGKNVETIDVNVQATVKGGGDYDPFVTVDGLPCWPSAPNYDRLIEGDELKAKKVDLESSWTTWLGTPKTLRRGVDFDRVVLGLSIAPLKYLAGPLMDASPAFKAMVEHVGTVQTQASQLWLDCTAEGLGWEASEPAIQVGYTLSGADMSHLIPAEAWPASADVRNIEYLCSALPELGPIPPPFSDPAFPGQQADRVRALSEDFLATSIRPLWPLATDPTNPDGLDWDLLVNLKDRQGEARFLGQYWRANVNPSERYVLSLKGSRKYRLKADASGFANVVLAGDWTDNGINAGCVEAAVISGLQAARALLGGSEPIHGERDL
jgi:uncharacterized protein with NAD-binding domain and iron-sulfur cluster